MNYLALIPFITTKLGPCNNKLIFSCKHRQEQIHMHSSLSLTRNDEDTELRIEKLQIRWEHKTEQIINPSSGLEEIKHQQRKLQSEIQILRFQTEAKQACMFSACATTTPAIQKKITIKEKGSIGRHMGPDCSCIRPCMFLCNFLLFSRN